MTTSYELDVNGITYPVTADQGKNLLSVIREDVGLTGTKEGCDDVSAAHAWCCSMASP